MLSWVPIQKGALSENFLVYLEGGLFLGKACSLGFRVYGLGSPQKGRQELEKVFCVLHGCPDTARGTFLSLGSHAAAQFWILEDLQNLTPGGSKIKHKAPKKAQVAASYHNNIPSPCYHSTLPLATLTHVR